MAEQYQRGTTRRMVNRLAGAMARRGMGASWIVSTTGRNSGTRRDFVITPVTYDGVRYLVAPYGEVSWVKNVRANAQVTLSRGSVKLRATAEEISGEEAGHALGKYYAENRRYVAKFMDIPGDHTITDFVAVVYRYPVFRIES